MFKNIKWKMFLLKIKLRHLKHKRKELELNCISNHTDTLAKVDKIEKINPYAFKEIDDRIKVMRRLIRISKHRQEREDKASCLCY